MRERLQVGTDTRSTRRILHSFLALVATVATVATVAGAWCSSSRRDGGAPSESGAEQQTTFLVKHTLFN